MKRRCCLLWLIIGLPSLALAQNIPSSPRSRQAIQRCRPLLAAPLARQGVAWGAPVFIRIFKVEKRLEMWLHTFCHVESKPLPFYTAPLVCFLDESKSRPRLVFRQRLYSTGCSYRGGRISAPAEGRSK